LKFFLLIRVFVVWLQVFFLWKTQFDNSNKLINKNIPGC